MQLLLEQSLELASWLTRIRRLLHQHPDLAFQERVTARRAVEKLH
ncbi:MAG: hypothetical protein OZSIB_1102 [Candidatus Ozemobacter sibiricus]|jgi:metal-dependent amidase/aminoacylase/carboxypeptidase family protein|uniref:Amidohydrolase n=1 Tax=Candidatus Ozemobacter sibiricus TaxID=2268124 RepID=A0A367ZLW3_9BACT|nr:MAG: hypothetical protein OZSIB_1102 [Candidatus Ozemobacter sibiricus]